MGKKFSLGITISLIAIACAITFVLTVTVSNNMFNQKIAGIIEREEIYSKIQEFDSYVRNGSLYPIDEETLMSSVINGYVSGLSDSEARYYTPDDYYKKQSIENGVLVGAGIDAVREESGYIKVSYIYPGSPAENQNIHVGDVITSIGGKNVLETGAENAIRQLEGSENSILELTVQQNGQEIPLSITRKSFTIRCVTSGMIKTAGYIRVNMFTKLTASQFIDAVQSLQSQGATGFIIDLRGTSGSYTSLQEMLSFFIPAKVLANAEYADGTVKKLLETTGTTEITQPVVILIDQTSGGAAELFAVCMKNYPNMKLVGTGTAGRDTITEEKGFTDGSALEITTARIVPVGLDSYSAGLKPDFLMDLTGQMTTTLEEILEGGDSQIQKALEVIESMK